MRYSIRALLAFLMLGMAVNVVNAGESQAVQSMAGILLQFQHYPSDSAKQTLGKIVEDKSSTADERTVAHALIDVQHVVAAADKPALEAIVADDKAAASIKTLANVILGLHHMPSDSDKEKLRALAS
jgi:hypothetical protein